MERKNKLGRIVAQNPIYSKYEGFCSVCSSSYSPGELISPYFDGDKNYWRHTACLQLFYLNFRFEGSCNDCEQIITAGEFGYWSKHNGVWCAECIEPKFPKISVAFARPLSNHIQNIIEAC